MPEWLEVGDIVYFQRLLVNEHGGLHGNRDKGALESTLARPQQLLHYEPNASIYELAASYGYGFAKNHVFNDGNKRISLTSIDIFLQINGLELIAEEVDAVLTIRDLAAGLLDESGLSCWIEENSNQLDLSILG
jgi:death-on-curing protein